MRYVIASACEPEVALTIAPQPLGSVFASALQPLLCQDVAASSFQYRQGGTETAEALLQILMSLTLFE